MRYFIAIHSRTGALIVIAGPNASGKSELAVRLAKKFNGEIVSADSRQVYRGLDIGSGKVPGRWQTVKHSVFNTSVRHRVFNGKEFVYKKVPHHCIDFVSPKKRYTVAEYQQCAMDTIADIHARGKIPFLVGGTGFYIKAVIDAFPFPKIPPQPGLRRRLEQKTTTQLAAMLKKKDLRRWREINRNNRRRLIRALEIISVTGKPVAKAKLRAPYHIFFLGLTLSNDALREKIARRLHERLKKGLITEVRKLRMKGMTWRRLDELGLEYRCVARHLRGKLTRKTLEEELGKEIWRYAQRQMTWFKKEKRIRWIRSSQEAENAILQFKRSAR